MPEAKPDRHRRVRMIFEVLLGTLLFVSKARALARWGVIALLIAVLPANIWLSGLRY